MASWGGTGAEALKNGIDNIFASDGKIPLGDYVTKLVSATSQMGQVQTLGKYQVCLHKARVSYVTDGASANFGQVSGMLTRMSQDCE